MSAQPMHPGGWAVGDQVCVGKNPAVWTIKAFGTRANGQVYAELHRPDRQFGELANVTRLVRAS